MGALRCQGEYDDGDHSRRSLRRERMYIKAMNPDGSFMHSHQ